MDQLDSSDGGCGVLELLEPQHRPGTRLDVAVILLNDIVEILARGDLDGPERSMLGAELANGPMGSLISVERDGARHTALGLESLAEERFGAAATSRLGLKRKSIALPRPSTA